MPDLEDFKQVEIVILMPLWNKEEDALKHSPEYSTSVSTARDKKHPDIFMILSIVSMLYESRV
jgi:hypothetical protein